MNLRVRIIQVLLDLNERIYFYPRLRKAYVNMLSHFGNGGKPELTVVDVGSNKGQSIEFFLSLNPRSKIFGFEPNVDLFDKLQHRYLGHSNVIVYNKGVSSSSEKRIFRVNVLDETSTFEVVNDSSEHLAWKKKVLGYSGKTLVCDQYEVQTTTLAEFLSDVDLTMVDVLKIDVEGHELDCLKGLFGDKGTIVPVRLIQLEEHRDDLYTTGMVEIEELLRVNGFEKRIQVKHGFGNLYDVLWLNKSIE